MTFKDHFSNQSTSYHNFRPTYPKELFDFIFSLTPEHELAWDCACGSGQASNDIAKGFLQVIASDASQAQLAQAQGSTNVRFECFPAECSSFEKNSVDVICVAQALHWFQFDKFFEECKRVLKPHAPLVVWSYGLSSISAEIDQLCLELYQGKLDQYWPAERRLVENAYASIEFPFKQVIRHSQFSMQQEWSREQFIGYLRSWSATQGYINAGYENPLIDFEKELDKYWKASVIKTIHWPLIVIEARD